jgi:hypothetical protein
MSEFISTSNYIKHKFEGGEFDKMHEIFDLDGDGIISQLEMDQAESYCLMNTMESIDPVTLNNLKNFQLDSGVYMTEKQALDRDRFMRLLHKYKQEQDEEDIRLTIKRRHDIPETDNGSLEDDLRRRRYLEDSEIHNQV